MTSCSCGGQPGAHDPSCAVWWEGMGEAGARIREVLSCPACRTDLPGVSFCSRHHPHDPAVALALGFLDALALSETTLDRLDGCADRPQVAEILILAEETARRLRRLLQAWSLPQ